MRERTPHVPRPAKMAWLLHPLLATLAPGAAACSRQTLPLALPWLRTWQECTSMDAKLTTVVALRTADIIVPKS